ncbi:MAG: transglycosylase SLT domain-containing protein [Pseudomonadota bacterium]
MKKKEADLNKIKKIEFSKNIFLILFLGMVFFVQAQGQSKDQVQSKKALEENLFEIPEKLQARVDFWKLIYSKYTTAEGLIHDDEDLSIIYGSVDLPQNISGSKRKKLLKNAKTRITNTLYSIVKKKKLNLNADEERILALFKDDNSITRLNRARESVRFQLGQKDRFIEGIKRSGRYLDEIKDIFDRFNMPKDLVYLPNVESSFNYQAYSKFGAAGIWQFTRSTGKLFLNIDSAVDERLDPILSTIAAAKLLRQNYEELQSWPLAITAYNHGLGGMKAAVRKLSTKDISIIIDQYNGRTFGFASKNFYAEFLAACDVFKNSHKYFGYIEKYKPLEYSVFILPDYIYLGSLQKFFKLNIDEVKKYNYSLRPPIFSNYQRIPRGFKLKLPKEEVLELASNYEIKLPKAHKYSAQKRSMYYKVRRGDTLSEIARKNRTSVAAIKAGNHIIGNRIYEGQRLKLPVTEKPVYLAQVEDKGTREQGGKSAGEQERKSAGEQERKITGEQDNKETVIKAETKVQAKEIKKIETAKKEPRTQKTEPKTKQIRSKAPSTFDYIRVDTEETLGHFADWLGLSASYLRKINGFRYGKNIHLGQKIKIDYQKVTKEKFDILRNEFHDGIEEDFWNNFSITSTFEYKLEKGDSLWYLCFKKFTIPLWLLKEQNIGKDLAKVMPGDILTIPVIVEK